MVISSGTKNNARCAICGKGYRMCNSCAEQKKLTPWKVVTDTSEHFKIFIALHRYNKTHDVAVAREDLSHCDLQGWEDFVPNVREMISEIMGNDSSYSDDSAGSGAEVKATKKTNNAVKKTVKKRNTEKPVASTKNNVAPAIIITTDDVKSDSTANDSADKKVNVEND